MSISKGVVGYICAESSVPILTNHSTRLPRKLANLLSSSQLKQVYHIVLGYEDSFLLTWRDNHDKNRIDSTGLPPELITFLYARNTQGQQVRNIPSVRCTLGPYNASYLAHDGLAYSWMSLPQALLSALQSRINDGDWTDRPRTVALGAGGNFVLLTEKNAAIWDLDRYRAAGKFMEKSKTQRDGIPGIHTLVLHPYRFESFVAQSNTGTLIFENLPPPSLGAIQAMIGPVIIDTKDVEWTPMVRISTKPRDDAPKRPSVLQQRAQLRKEWNNHTQDFSAQKKGMKVSLSLSVSIGGLTRMLG